MKRLFSLLFITLFLFGLTACSQQTTNTTKAPASQKVRVAEVTRSLFYAPEYVALSKGFFKDEGLDIELTTTAGGDKTMTALLSNGADIALVGSESSIYIYNQGAKDPVINFAGLTQTDGTFLVSRKKIDNFNWTQLNGANYLGQRPGGMPEMVGEYVLKKHGINPQKDINLNQKVDFANLPAAFVGGTGDFVQLFEPTASILEKEGKGYIVASFGMESGTVPYTSFMAKESYLKNNKDTVTKFTAAIYKAQQWVDTHSSQEIADAVKDYFKDTPQDIAVKVIDRYKNQHSYATNPILTPAEWANLQTIMKDGGQLKNEVPYSTLVTTDFIQK